MKKIICCMAFLLLMTGMAPAVEEAPVAGGGPEAALLTLKVPLFSPLFAQVPVAKVNDEHITMDEFKKALGVVHAGRTEGSPGARKDYGKVLQRLVTARLIAQEARAMGMHELSEVKELVRKYRESALRELLRHELVKNIKADESEVERVYRQMIREYRIRSVMFRTEAEARVLADAVAAGGSFEELAGQARANRTAQGLAEAETIKAADLNPAIAAALAGMKPGEVSRPVPVQPGFVLFKLEEEKAVESDEARETAREQVLTGKKHEALIEHNQKLSRQYLTFHTRRIDSIDFTAPKPGMEKLLQDKRVLVEVKGERPVTVSDLATALDQQLYHGSKNAAKKTINDRKRDVLEELVAKRVLLAEAKRRGMNKTDAYKAKVKEYEDSLLFGLFIQRVVGPEVKPSEEELKTYYDQHSDDYLVSGKVRFDVLAFTGKDYAEAAAGRLRQGTELRWLRENAEGQVPAEDLLQYGDQFVWLDELPPSLKKELADARAGDVKLATLPDGTVTVLVVQDTKPSEPLPFELAQEQISSKLFDENLRRVLDSWAERLKEGTEVTLYLTAAQ